MELKSIAIDGPSGAGKSTLAKMLAKKFEMIYVDTGAMYRTVGLYILQNGENPKDETAVCARLTEINIEMCYDDEGTQRMLLNGNDVTEQIRMPQVSIYASNVSAIPKVRAFLLDMQRELAKKYNVVMDGRDIGTVVLPNAGIKIFLSASPEIRAKRRYLELCEKGVVTTIEDVLRDINIRDENDSTRAASPLTPAEDSIPVDTSEITLDESFKLMSDIIQSRLAGK